MDCVCKIIDYSLVWNQFGCCNFFWFGAVLVYVKSTKYHFPPQGWFSTFKSILISEGKRMYLEQKGRGSRQGQ